MRYFYIIAVIMGKNYMQVAAYNQQIPASIYTKERDKNNQNFNHSTFNPYHNCL